MAVLKLLAAALCGGLFAISGLYVWFVWYWNRDGGPF